MKKAGVDQLKGRIVRKTALVIATAATALASAIGTVQIAYGEIFDAPVGLSAYGRLIWNLDALVHDRYGSEHVCVRRARRFAVHPCRSAFYNNGDYRATFANARHSRFRALARSSNPIHGVNVVPITIGGRYIQCGTDRWLAITNAPAGWGEAVDCVKP
jgi:hypothetical protein